MKSPNNMKKLFSLILVLFLLFTLSIPLRPSISPAKANTNDQIAEIEKKLKELQAQKDALNAQIKKEQQNQTNLTQQSRNLDRAIQQNEIQIRSLELELEKTRLEVQVLKEEQTKLQARLAEVQGNLAITTNELNVSINLLYKLSLSNPGILTENGSFQESVLNEEKEKSTMRIIKATINDIKNLEKEVLDKKTEIDTKEKQASDLKTELEAKSNNLNMQQQALKWQKDNKLRQITQSQQNQQNLTDQQREANQKIAQIQAELAAIMNALLKTPRTGTYVSAGQIIGFQGRSGLSCGVYDPSLVPVRTNSYCNDPYPKGAGLNSDWYYYDPVKFPTRGAHLHFVYQINGAISCNTARAALTDPNNNTFAAMPMSSFYMSQGCHDGGAVDIVSNNGFGAPVYSVKAGFVSYMCVRFPKDPSFPDPLFGAIVEHVDSTGKKDGTVSGYWHLKRGIACDNIWAN